MTWQWRPEIGAPKAQRLLPAHARSTGPDAGRGRHAPDHQQLGVLFPVTADHHTARAKIQRISRQTILSSTGSANHQRISLAGKPAGQQHDRVSGRQGLYSVPFRAIFKALAVPEDVRS